MAHVHKRKTTNFLTLLQHNMTYQRNGNATCSVTAFTASLASENATLSVSSHLSFLSIDIDRSQWSVDKVLFSLNCMHWSGAGLCEAISCSVGNCLPFLWGSTSQFKNLIYRPDTVSFLFTFFKVKNIHLSIVYAVSLWSAKIFNKNAIKFQKLWKQLTQR